MLALEGQNAQPCPAFGPALSHFNVNLDSNWLPNWLQLLPKRPLEALPNAETFENISKPLVFQWSFDLSSMAKLGKVGVQIETPEFSQKSFKIAVLFFPRCVS